jgi:DNA-binding transcriptional regulator YdaS (Cro superfamily)
MFDIQSILRQRRGLAISISREIGITHGAVSQWRRVPIERVAVVERLTGIPREVLRPDIFAKSTSPKSKPDTATA